jgi:hypothetical protein
MSLFDHLVRAHKQRWRHCEAERIRGLEINDQLDFGGLLDWTSPTLFDHLVGNGK